mmetsp:Transcript_19809/g.55051  ORF Transcript_19809/g.55051 Transcript_19809/m.55051 type:complete len:204 (-) Transcript_19809:221-832(-)
MLRGKGAAVSCAGGEPPGGLVVAREGSSGRLGLEAQVQHDSDAPHRLVHVEEVPAPLELGAHRTLHIRPDPPPGRRLPHLAQLLAQVGGPQAARVAEAHALGRRRGVVAEDRPRALRLVVEETDVGGVGAHRALPQRPRLVVALDDELQVWQRRRHPRQVGGVRRPELAAVKVVGLGCIELKSLESIIIPQFLDIRVVAVEKL